LLRTSKNGDLAMLGECDVPQKAMLTVRQPRQKKPKVDSQIEAADFR
jgi:hypothetical protein